MYREVGNLGRLLLIRISGENVVAHDRKSGVVVWHHMLDEYNIGCASRCVVGGEHVWVVSAGALVGNWAPQSPLIVECMYYTTGARVWRQKVDFAPGTPWSAPTLLLDEGQLFIACANELLVLDAATGAGLWRAPIESGNMNAVVSTLALPGVVSPADRA
jgi:outer membrane protein assembly factor BamB